MAALYTVGATLPNGNTVVTDTFTQNGSFTTETVLDSAGNNFTINNQTAGSPQANQALVTERVNENLATLQSWIAANPNGAVLTAAQTLVLAKMIVALTLFVTNNFTTVTGT